MEQGNTAFKRKTAQMHGNEMRNYCHLIKINGINAAMKCGKIVFK